MPKYLIGSLEIRTVCLRAAAKGGSARGGRDWKTFLRARQNYARCHARGEQREQPRGRFARQVEGHRVRVPLSLYCPRSR
jgi:hypothetical protein